MKIETKIIGIVGYGLIGGSIGLALKKYTDNYVIAIDNNSDVLNYIETNKMADEVSYISRLCDKNNIPFASNIGTAEALVMALGRGDLDWRYMYNPASNRPIA